jgi:hypothetical protein
MGRVGERRSAHRNSCAGNRGLSREFSEIFGDDAIGRGAAVARLFKSWDERRGVIYTIRRSLQKSPGIDRRSEAL